MQGVLIFVKEKFKQIHQPWERGHQKCQNLCSKLKKKKKNLNKVLKYTYYTYTYYTYMIFYLVVVANCKLAFTVAVFCLNT